MESIDRADDRRLIDALGARADLTVLHPGTIAALDVRLEDGRPRATLAGRDLVPDVVLPWRVPTACAHPKLDVVLADASVATYHRLQWSTMLRGLVAAWELLGTPVVNGSDARRWDEKTAQVVAAAAAGFGTVATLQSAQGGSIRAFLDDLGGPAIHKSFVPFHRYDPARRVATRSLTRVVDASVYDASFDEKVPTPALFQPLAEATTELRVAVIGDRTFAAAIDRTRLGNVDARFPSPEDLPASLGVLSPGEEAACRALVRTCGLDLAVIDLLRNDDGPPVFLDLNPSGVFDWIAARFDLPVYEALADLVVSRGEAGPSPWPPDVGGATATPVDRAECTIQSTGSP